MKSNSDYFDEFDDNPDKFYDEVIPDVEWENDFENIENPDISEKEIELAKEIVERKNELIQKYDNGEISEDAYLSQREHLKEEGKEASDRAGYRSGRLSRDYLGDRSEDWNELNYGNINKSEKLRRLDDAIDELGSEISEKVADIMLDDRKIEERTHEQISDRIELHKK